MTAVSPPAEVAAPAEVAKNWKVVFVDEKLESSFQEARAKWIATSGVQVARALAGASVLLVATCNFDGHTEAWIVRIFWLVAALYGLAGSVILARAPHAYDALMFGYALLAVLAASLSPDSLAYIGDNNFLRPAGLVEVNTLVLVGIVLVAAVMFVQLTSGLYLALVHLAIIINLIVTLSIGSLACTCTVGVASGNNTLVVEHLRSAVYLYILSLFMFLWRQKQEVKEREGFSAGTTKLEEGRTLVQAAAPAPEAITPTSPSPAGGAAAITPKAAAAAPAMPRDLTVPPPPAYKGPEVEEEATKKRGVSRAPNPLLVRCMSGRTADWDRIDRMARNIRVPSYGLREFFDDCVGSFPELSLFFDDTPIVHRTAGKRATSGMSGEAEYQRTVGALFTVYWMLRQDSDGPAGFCYGSDENWQPIKPQPAVKGKSFFKMTPDEKRASFMETMEWKSFGELVNRAGCAATDLGCTERIKALLCLTAFHDVMKVAALQPIVQPDHAPYNGYDAGVRIHDHDLALSYVLEHFPKLLPSFCGLQPANQRGVLFTQGKMQFNHGWFVQAESPPGCMLSKFKALLEAGCEQRDIDLYFLHWITDLAGAEATPLGGAEKLVLKFPHAVLASFLWSMPYLSRLAGVSETSLVEQYLEARWRVLVPNEPVPNDSTSIAVMRLAVMAQGEDAFTVVEAFRALSSVDKLCLVTELSRTGAAGQTFDRHTVCGGPAFLIYYAPALLQRNNGSKETLEIALHTLCVVLRGARAIWPMGLKAEGNTVIIQVGELKSRDINSVVKDPGGEVRSVWVLQRNNDHEGAVLLVRASELNALFMEGARFRALDFTIEKKEDEGMGAANSGNKMLEVKAGAGESPSNAAFRGSKRILVFTDMSTECDDECALLWLLAALNRRPFQTTIELVLTDSHMRFQWMSHIFGDKFAPGGDWELKDGGSSFQYNNVLVNMYLAQSPGQRETTIIEDIMKKAHKVPVEMEQRGNFKVAVRRPGTVGGEEYTTIPGDNIDIIVVAAAIPDVDPEFFKRFTTCKCAYVVGSPGGINCPMPSWVDLLAAMHRLSPVLYLTPQFTREIRFPRNYVVTNMYWNETIRRTVWHTALTFMACRPEIPPKASAGNWGLLLRLNVANALFCRDWYLDVVGKKITEAERPDEIVKIVKAYVDRNSGYDRQFGGVVDELRVIGVDVSPEALRVAKSELNAKGQPISQAAREAIRSKYRHELFEHTFVCVLTTETVLWQHKQNKKVGVDDMGVEKLQPRCGYTDSSRSLAELYGVDEAISLVQTLPLHRLIPVYDVVAMICADSALEDGMDLDGGLGLLLDHADETMGLGMLSEEQRRLSDHPVLMTLPQTGEGVYGVGPFN